ncbi:MAG: efflux transporter outer membrane subunit [Myxococcales bacterium]|jgi:NodT family efflux transporter outer membrane factor (OMF) lipoprotein
MRGLRPRQWSRALGNTLASTALLACSPHDVTHDPQAPVELPETYGGEQTAQAPKPGGEADADPGRWWQQFGDPELNRLVSAALEGNFDLQGAWARLAQANAMADQAGAPRWPALDLSVGGAENRRIFSFPGIGNRSVWIESASASAAVSYEVDLWDKLGSGAKAASLERDAAADSVEVMAMSLSAEISEAWLDLVEVRARRALLQSQQEINERFLELLEMRLGQGLSTAVDINQQKQMVIDNAAQLELTISREATLENRIAVLTGKPPGRLDVAARSELPQPPALPAVGVPSELLRRRPDVRAARRRVEAADYRLAAAIADRYPSIQLTGSVSSQPSSLNEWLLTPLWSLAGSIAAPIFDGGRRAAEVDRQHAIVSESIASYANTLLTAILEVENALAQAGQQRKHIEQLEEQLEVAELTLQQARERYANGLSDFLTVLTVLRSQQQVELSLLAARRQLLSHRIQLCRALGGSWMAELQPPELLKPRDAERDEERGGSS